MSRFDPVVFRRTSFSCASALKPALLLRSLRDTSENWWNGKQKNQMVLSWRNVSILKYLLNYTIHWYKHSCFVRLAWKRLPFFSEKLCSPWVALLLPVCLAMKLVNAAGVLIKVYPYSCGTTWSEFKKKSHHKTTGVLPINFDAVSEVKRNPRASCKK